MSINSGIEWTESTWNPVTGCSKISSGCLNCYAERMARRLAGRYGYPKTNPFKVTIHKNRLPQPLKWPGNQMIFVCSMSDLFHTDVPDKFIFAILEIMKECPHHIFQILTKRADRLLEFSKKIDNWPKNVWIGVTVEEKEFIKRIEILKQVDAAVRFLSCEPLLNDLGKIDLNGIDWLIVGGESGPNARPMNLKWVTNLRDQSIKRGIPYFFKQWGGINKKASGRCLEGKIWDQMPKSSLALVVK
jgi:protein gp37